MKIVNPWKADSRGNFEHYDENDKVVEYGDYAIFHQFGNNYLYVYKDKAFNCLAGLNKQHLIDVAERKGSGFLYERALENLRVHGIKK